MKEMGLALELESSGAFRFVEAISYFYVVKFLSLQDGFWIAFVILASGLLVERSRRRG